MLPLFFEKLPSMLFRLLPVPEDEARGRDPSILGVVAERARGKNKLIILCIQIWATCNSVCPSEKKCDEFGVHERLCGYGTNELFINTKKPSTYDVGNGMVESFREPNLPTNFSKAKQ